MRLTEADVGELQFRFPELDWMSPEDWQKVNGLVDWNAWFDAEADRCTWGDPDLSKRVQIVTKLRKNRIKIRNDCRLYFGRENVDNINDPDDPTWA
tara:strand:- start:2322 stop:2609 length:288 start_codon:yes stop_codon:yes gene_type:complete